MGDSCPKGDTLGGEGIHWGLESPGEIKWRLGAYCSVHMYG